MFFTTLNSFVNFLLSLADRNGFILSNEKRFNAGKGRHNLTITAKKKMKKSTCIKANHLAYIESR